MEGKEEGGCHIPFGAGRELVGGITPFRPLREARRQAEGEWSVRSQRLTLNPLRYLPGGTSGVKEPIKGKEIEDSNPISHTLHSQQKCSSIH